ncbi:serine/threonine-protein phosphatase 7 long form-like protein [Cucumis melo var. makuwa]|uniref:Serine/threonine-protein phosphatase 7 long form-like protein n=1 Tax=Cucumis melo var. makuwa TaxID=1194695 RepID=A0A5D3CWN0_CUCMM|nr:serine/threonine-protein phosphatase 7 long form-like protein [Cucumis melo var. makuwa]
MPVDSIQSNTQTIGLSYHSPKFARMRTYLKDPVDQELPESIMKWIGKSMINHSDALSGKGLPGWVHVVRLTFDYCTGRALETRNPYISYALWGVHDHAGGCYSAVGVASGQGAFDRIIEFQELPPDADVVNIQRYARVYIMQLIGGFLFADKSNTLVHCMFLQFIFDFDQAGTYAWGAVTLAWLYRELCRVNHAQSLEITGPLMLVQVWAYDRFPIIVPQRPLQHSDGRSLSFRYYFIYMFFK